MVSQMFSCYLFHFIYFYCLVLLGWSVDWGPFLESPETLRAILGCHNFLCNSRTERIFKLSNFTIIFLFVTLKACKKIGFPKPAIGSFTNGFSGPKRFRDFRETGP